MPTPPYTDGETERRVLRRLLAVHAGYDEQLEYGARGLQQQSEEVGTLLEVLRRRTEIQLYIDDFAAILDGPSLPGHVRDAVVGLGGSLDWRRRQRLPRVPLPSRIAFLVARFDSRATSDRSDSEEGWRTPSGTWSTICSPPPEDDAQAAATAYPSYLYTTCTPRAA